LKNIFLRGGAGAKPVMGKIPCLRR